MYTKFSVPSWTRLHKKWCAILLCFVRVWCSGWWAIDTVAWLSEKIVEVEGRGIPTSLSKDLCQITCLAQCIAATYSASVVDNATVDFFFKLHATAPTLSEGQVGPNPVHVYLNQNSFKSKSLWWITLKNKYKNPYQSNIDLNEIWLRYTHTGSGSDPALRQCNGTSR